MKKPRPRNRANKQPSILHLISVVLVAAQGLHSGLTSSKRYQELGAKVKTIFWRNFHFWENYLFK